MTFMHPDRVRAARRLAGAFLIVVVLVGMRAPAVRAATQDVSADMAAVGAVVDAFVRAWSGTAPAELAALLTDDVQAFDIGFTERGRAAVERRRTELPQRLQGVRIIESPELTLSGNLAFATLTVSGHNDTPSGPMQVWFRCSLVVRRLDGDWRVDHYHLSGDPDRPRAF